jgi:hypothetical protein
VGSYFSGGQFLLAISRIIRGSLDIHTKHMKCGGNDAVNERGTVHVLVVISQLSDWLVKTESNRCPHARSSPQSFAPFIKTIPVSVQISDWRSKNISTESFPLRVACMPCIMLKTRVNAYGECRGLLVCVFLRWCMCLVLCVWIDTLGNASFVVVSIKLWWFLCQRVD